MWDEWLNMVTARLSARGRGQNLLYQLDHHFFLSPSQIGGSGSRVGSVSCTFFVLSPSQIGGSGSLARTVFYSHYVCVSEFENSASDAKQSHEKAIDR